MKPRDSPIKAPPFQRRRTGHPNFKIPQSPGHPTYQVYSEGGADNVV